MNSEKPSVGSRLGSMILDHIFMTSAVMFFSIPSIVSGIPSFDKNPHKLYEPFSFDSTAYIALIGFAIYFCKDSIHGRSIAKRLLNLTVIDIKTGKSASPLKCFVRNIFCVIWPLEVFIVLFSTSKRIGDFVAGTKVINYNPNMKGPNLNIQQIIISLVLAYVILLIPTLLFF